MATSGMPGRMRLEEIEDAPTQPYVSPCQQERRHVLINDWRTWLTHAALHGARILEEMPGEAWARSAQHDLANIISLVQTQLAFETERISANPKTRYGSLSGRPYRQQ